MMQERGVMVENERGARFSVDLRSQAVTSLGQPAE